jgi:hypothetical protein
MASARTSFLLLYSCLASVLERMLFSLKNESVFTHFVLRLSEDEINTADVYRYGGRVPLYTLRIDSSYKLIDF